MVIPYHSQLTSNLTVLFILSFDSCCLNIQLKKIPIVLHMFCNPKNKHRTCKNIPLKKKQKHLPNPHFGVPCLLFGGCTTLNLSTIQQRVSPLFVGSPSLLATPSVPCAKMETCFPKVIPFKPESHIKPPPEDLLVKTGGNE